MRYFEFVTTWKWWGTLIAFIVAFLAGALASGLSGWHFMATTFVAIVIFDATISSARKHG